MVRVANELQGPAVDLRAGPQQRLRRPRAARQGLDPRQPARDEPGARGRRGARLRGRRAGRALLRPARPPRGRRPRAVAVDPRHRLGQRRRQHARVRARLHALRRASGDLLRARGRARRTASSCEPGWAGMSNSQTWNTYQWSFGPSHAGLFFQSNLGIVTKMGVWLMRRPDVYLSGWAPLRRRRDRRAVDRRDARADARRARSATSRSSAHGLGIGEGEIDVRRGGLGAALRALRPRGDRRRAVRDRARGARGDPGRRGRPPASTAGRSAPTAVSHNDKVQGGIPGMELMDAFKIPYGEDTGHLDLSLVGPLRGGDLVESIATLRSLYGAHRVPLPRRDPVPDAQPAAHLDAVLRHQGRAPDARRLRHLRDARRRDGAARLRRLPHQHPAHGRRRRHASTGTTTRSGGSTSCSRTRSTRTASSRPGKQGIWPKSMRE